MSFDPRTLVHAAAAAPFGCRCPHAFSMLGSSSGLLNFALSQDAAIVKDLTAGNAMQAVRDALATPWNPNPTDAQAQAALADPQNANNVLLIIQRAGATPAQLKTIPQPGQVNYQTPAVTAALQKLQGVAPSGGTVSPAPAAPAPAPAPPPPPAPAANSSATNNSAPNNAAPTTSTSLTPDQVSQIVGSIQNGLNTTGTVIATDSPAGGPTRAAPPAGFTFGPDGVTLVPIAGDSGKPVPGQAAKLAPLSTGPLDFLTAPLTIPFVGVQVPTWTAVGAAAGLGWLLFRGRAHA